MNPLLRIVGLTPFFYLWKKLPSRSSICVIFSSLGVIGDLGIRGWEPTSLLLFCIFGMRGERPGVEGFSYVQFIGVSLVEFYCFVKRC